MDTPYTTPEACYRKAPVRRLRGDERLLVVMLAFRDDQRQIRETDSVPLDEPIAFLRLMKADA